jgi:hypothetical protein
MKGTNGIELTSKGLLAAFVLQLFLGDFRTDPATPAGVGQQNDLGCPLLLVDGELFVSGESAIGMQVREGEIDQDHRKQYHRGSSGCRSVYRQA